jgi:hypothetical protein
MYALADFQGRKPAHFHLDLTTDRSFGSDIKTVKIADFQAVLERLEGQRVDASIEGFFQLTREDVPPFLRSALVRAKAGGVSIEAVSGSFMLQGAPVHRIDWSVVDDDFIIQLIGSRIIVVDENYLTNAFQLMESAFAAITRGGQYDARR